ncbi:MAG: DUF4236 domain-containing protein [Lachnospiraceae bacterium]|nr:DUF4236 domain-containing protein [Lachnospiraceae bacterium]
MGLRFRKSISILPGVKLNLGTKGASVSVGKRGMHYTMHTSGRKTVSVGLPGTGLSYVKTIGSGSKSTSKKTTKPLTGYRDGKSNASLSQAAAQELAAAQQEAANYTAYVDELKSLHKACDPVIDWRAVCDGDVTAYGYEKLKDIAIHVLGGDVEAYYKAVEIMQPYEDLRNFGSTFEFGTDASDFAEVQFGIMEEEVMPVIEVSVTQSGKLSQKDLTKSKYYDLLQDYVCSTCIRTARDTFALLPVETVYVHAVKTMVNPATGLDEEETLVSIKFTREWFEKVDFERIDPSEFMSLFECRMKFGKTTGFAPVIRLSSGQ